VTLESIALDRDRAYPPRVTDFTATFWNGLAMGKFQTTRCTACAMFSFPPKPFCPHCWSRQVSWEDLATDGTLYSWTRIHAGPAVFESELPYDVGVVDLDAGIRLAVRLHATRQVEWRCNQRVRLVRLQYRDGSLFAAVAV
jgi:uncharacterized OB-fold protein